MKVIAVALYRLSHLLGAKVGFLGMVVKQLNQLITGADIAYEARFGPGFRLLHPVGVVVAPGVVAGANCTLHAGVVLGGRPEGVPQLGDNVNLGPHVCITGPVVLGDRAHVGANSVVTRSFPESGVVLVGAPARSAQRASDKTGSN